MKPPSVAATHKSAKSLSATLARIQAAMDRPEVEGESLAWDPSPADLDAAHVGPGEERITDWVEGSAKDVEDARAIAEARNQVVLGVRVCTVRRRGNRRRRFAVWAYGFGPRS